MFLHKSQLQEPNVTTDKSNIFFQNTISLTNMTVLNDGVFMKFNDASEARKYTFYRQTSTNPYNVKILLLNATHGNFTVTTTGLTDTKLNITGSQVSALLDNISTTVIWNGILNTINSGACICYIAFISRHYQTHLYIICTK